MPQAPNSSTLSGLGKLSDAAKLANVAPNKVVISGAVVKSPPLPSLVATPE